jgi:hypothetical protein
MPGHPRLSLPVIPGFPFPSSPLFLLVIPGLTGDLFKFRCLSLKICIEIPSSEPFLHIFSIFYPNGM